ncbi:MAG TPA: C45 family peptidase [Candidatus Sulfotelmatobacter sp.]|nr:C45 family peptidase [Candidatus Sulfotelmatobacter sp.]
MRQTMFAVLLLVLATTCLLTSSIPSSQAAAPQAELQGGYRLPEKNGWTFVHLQGTPHQVGFQNGYLLATEIEDYLKVVQLEAKHDYKKDWSFFREAAENMMWPHIEQEYREELQGIADGAAARGAKIDLWDVVGINAAPEWGYYNKQYDTEHGTKTAQAVPEHCSAFVATGHYTKDGKAVIAHNNWSSYLEGERWTVVFDIAPTNGYRMLMDGLPGVIHSADDFVINTAGIAITETTIGNFSGFDTAGIPEFVRARKAAQYAASIDDFTRIMKDGNNGGYANAWLLADTHKNEIGRLELGLKNVTLERSSDGVFVGSNFPINPKLIREETNFDPSDVSQSSVARHIRWDQLMAENKGKIDVAAAQRFLADHYDSYEKKVDPDERSLDGHIDLSPRGSKGWMAPYGIAGAVQNKAADANMISKMTFTAAAGHACGMDFKAAAHLKAHPEYEWQRTLQRDMNAYPWTAFSAAQ